MPVPIPCSVRHCSACLTRAHSLHPCEGYFPFPQGSRGQTADLAKHQQVFFEASVCVRSWVRGEALRVTEGKCIQARGNRALNLNLSQLKEKEMGSSVS